MRPSQIRDFRFAITVTLLTPLLAMATEPIDFIVKPIPPRQAAAFHVEATAANLARDFDIVITHPDWDCHSRIQLGASGVIKDTVLVGMVWTQGQGAECPDDAAPVVVKTWLPGVVPTGIYTWKFSGFASCTPHCSGNILWEGVSNPVELDLKRLPSALAPLAAARDGFTARFSPGSQGRIEINLPQGLIGGRAELFDASGERIAASALGTDASGAASLALASKPKAGVYVLRVHNEGATARSMRVAIP